MTQKLKRDQLAPAKVKEWRKNFKQEMKETFNLQLSDIILQKETYKTLTGENENRVRVYLGLEKNDKGYVLCGFAVSTFLLGSGDVYVDYETPVFKLTPENENFSDGVDKVIESIRLYRKWRAGEIDEKAEGAVYRKFIYPNAYLLTKFELHEIFNIQNKEEAKIELGISKTMKAMISPVDNLTKSAETDLEVFDYVDDCPPFCDDRSPYNQ